MACAEGVVPRLVGYHGERAERVAKKAGFELAGVAPETVPRGPLFRCHEVRMTADEKYALAMDR